jgi:hypothetical protein
MSDGIRCLLMRGGTSKGAFFLAADLPQDVSARDDLLLRIMGSPDPRQIDGIGGADPLTSKVAILHPPVGPMQMSTIFSSRCSSTSRWCPTRKAAATFLRASGLLP